MNGSQRFLFICGGLEPGKDGIGDYSRRIAGKLGEGGNHSMLLSFGDAYAPQGLGKLSLGDTPNVNLFRSYASLTEDSVFQAVHNILNQFSPSMVCIQYNPYSFNRKGLPFRFLFALKRLLGSLPAHIVFHELWNSLDFPISFGSKLYSPLQKQAALLLMREMNVVSSFTTNVCYQTMLLRLGILTDLVPVFSNIPVTQSAETDEYEITELAQVVSCWQGPVMAVFGNQVGSLSPLKISRFLGANGFKSSPILLIVIGSQSPNSRILVEKIWGSLPENSRLLYSGFLGEASASALLHKIDCALTTYPFELAGKSTSIAAITEHGKSVFFVGKNIVDNLDVYHLDGSHEHASFRLDAAACHIYNAAEKAKV